MQWMLENHSFLDPKRVGIIGWSHGGLITLMNIFQHPQGLRRGLRRRARQRPGGAHGIRDRRAYAALYSAPYHIGKSVRDDMMEYRKRSPVYHAKELDTPLLIHTNTNDEDVNVLEVEHLIEALKAEGKKFEYKIYQDAPGGHYFNRHRYQARQGFAAAKSTSFWPAYLKPDRPAQ